MENIPTINVDEIKPLSNRCAPNVEFVDGSCLTIAQLSVLADEYNRHSSNQIPINKKFETLHPREYKIYLLFELQERLGFDQTDWINKKYFKGLPQDFFDTVAEHTFLPNGPNGKFEWLSNFDIDAKMAQYMEKYPDFKWLGAIPVDFEEYAEQFKGLNFAELEAIGKHRFGMVINMDKHDQSGSHWVSLIFDLKKGQIYYIDSVGTPPPELVSAFMKKVEKYIKGKGGNITVDLRHNDIQNQKGNSECGIYSIRSILVWLKKGDAYDFDKFKNKVVSDKNVHKCRPLYFNNGKV
jgi:hypothetical protein